MSPLKVLFLGSSKLQHVLCLLPACCLRSLACSFPATISTLLLMGSKSATANTWLTAMRPHKMKKLSLKLMQSLFIPLLSPAPFIKMPCSSFLWKPVRLFLMCLLGPQHLDSHICKPCSAMKSTRSAYCCFYCFSRKLRLSSSLPLSVHEGLGRFPIS